jgi:thiol-disulfide isomerase/thioredoxin
LGADLHKASVPVTVPAAGRGEVEVGQIRLTPKKIALLQGERGPELRGVVGWKNSAPLTLAGLRGKVVVLEFWGYCRAPCIAHMPALFELHERYKDKGLVVLGLHVDTGGEVDTEAKLDDRLAAARKGKDVPFPVALLKGGAGESFGPGVDRGARSLAAADYGVDGYPTTIRIDRRGRVAGRGAPGSKATRDLIENLLGEK